MKLPGFASLILLAYLFLVLPRTAIRSAARLRRMQEGIAGTDALSREAIWLGTLFGQSVLLVLAGFVGRGFGFQLLAIPHIGILEIAATIAALLACFALAAVARATRSHQERRRLVVHHIAPRSTREQVLWVFSVLLAAVAEEAAYRGVGWTVLTYSLGNAAIAAVLLAVAFTAAHWAQGWKSGAVIFTIALVMHGLVAYTGTLVLAMAVHAAYNLIAGERIRREALRYDAEAAAVA